MFTLISVDIVKSLGCRRISHSLSKNYARKYSSLYVKKTSEKRSFCSHSEKCLLTLKCHTVFSSSEFHGLSHRSSAVLVKVQEICPLLACNYQTKSKDFNKEDDDNSEIENKGKNVLDDLEFHNILKDFARDFGVDDENRQILEEIKQQHSSPFDGDTEKPSGEALCTNNELEFRNDTAVRTTKCSPLVNNELNESSDQHFEETEEDGEFFHIDQELKETAEYDSKRGKEGVYDVDDLVTVLRKENLLDVCVIQVPISLHYADYLVLATAKSPRHCQAIMEFIIKLYKKKKNKEDPFVICQGKTTTTWKALDMGNIVLHIFLEATRNFYDIESLWLLDKKYDKVGSLKNDPNVDMMQQHMDFLSSLNTQ